jgi:hypothetical protein
MDSRFQSLPGIATTPAVQRVVASQAPKMQRPTSVLHPSRTSAQLQLFARPNSAR